MGHADAVLLRFVGEVIGLLDLEELRRGLLRALLAAIPCRWASLNEVGPERVAALVEPHLDEVWYRRFAELADQNPLYRHWLRTRDGRAYRFSDVTTRAELEATPLYREVYAPLGIEHQMAFTLPNAADHILAIVLHRADRDFTDEERDLCNRARPFILEAYRNAVLHTQMRERSVDSLKPVLCRHGLTPRQADALSLVALGRSNGDVALELGLSERTVQKHLERAFRRLDVAGRSAAAARAWDLVSSEGDHAERLTTDARRPAAP